MSTMPGPGSERVPRVRSFSGWILAVLGAAALAYLLTTGGFVAWLAVGIGQSQSIAQQQCTLDLSTGGEAVPLPSRDPSQDLHVRAATWNTLNSNSVGNVIAGLRKLTATADVIGLQEFRPKIRGARVRAAFPDFGFSSAGTGNTIIWRKSKYDATSQGAVQELGVVRLEGGPIGTSIGPKYLQWVRLQDRQTHASFVFANNHLLPHIEANGHPDRRRSKQYLGYAQKQIAVELQHVDKFKSRGLPVVVTKDANWSATASARTKNPASPYVQSARHGLYTSWQVLGYPDRGTEGSRLIDSVASTTSLLVPIRQRIGDKTGSDHSAVDVTLTNVAASIAGAARTSSTRPNQGAAAKVGNLTNAQMAVAQSIYTTTVSVSRERSWTPKDTEKAFIIAAATAMKESTLGADPRSHRPDSNGDGGIYGQRTKPGWYGTIQQVNDPAYGTRIFLTGRKVTTTDVTAARTAGVTPAGPVGYTIPGLTQIQGWPAMPLAEASHRIQRSAFPDMPPSFEAVAHALWSAFKISLNISDAAIATNLSNQCQAAGQDLPASDDIGTSTGCPLDDDYAPGNKNPRSCDGAIRFLQDQMASGSRQWYRSCLALVARAYGWGWSGVATAGLHAGVERQAGQLHTSRTNIPRGAVMWWTNSGAGHVAIYDGDGYIYSNDVTGHGTVGRVKWDYPEKVWGQHFAGWSAPYFPRAGGSA